MSAIETISYANGITCKFYHDEDCESPVIDDEAVKVVILHRRYGNPASDVGGTPDEVLGWIKANRKEWYVTNLFMYEHSGVVLRAGEANPFGDPWDSGQVGIVAIKKSEFGKGKGERNSTRLQYCKDIAEEYGMWMNGDTYEYVIEDEDGNVLDSCSGFIGFDLVQDEAKASAEYYVRQAGERQVALTYAENNCGAGI